MRTKALLTAALVLFLGTGAAKADPLHFSGDREFSLGMRAGTVYSSDDQLTATWVRPLMLDFAYSLSTDRRCWLKGVQFYGLFNLEYAKFRYQERANNANSSGFLGIHDADMQVPLYPTGGFGVRFTLLELKRWHLSAFVEGVTTFTPMDTSIDAMVIDVSGLQIDVAKPAREHADVQFSWRTITAGATVARMFTPRRIKAKLIPYITLGVVNYRAQLDFNAKPELVNTLTQLHVDPSVLRSRVFEKSNFYGMTGLRVDLTDRWSLDLAGLFGNLNGTWIVSANLGAVVRFGSPKP